MDHAGRALKNANKGLSVEDVDNMMDEIQDAKDVADEINEAIARPLANSYEYDDDELLAELEELEQEELDSKMLDVPSTSLGPSLEPPFNPYDTQTQLRQLENWSENDASLDVPVAVSPTDTVRTRAQIREIEDWMGQ
jgi:charged multivesicular body protein 4